MAADMGYVIEYQPGRELENEKIKIKIKGNYARVEVFYQTLNVKSITQNPVYPVSFVKNQHYISTPQNKWQSWLAELASRAG